MKKLLSTLLFLFVVAIISLSAQNRIYTPTLLEPEDGDDGQMPDVVLNWAAVAGTGGIVTYEVQLDITDAFTNPFAPPATEFAAFQMENLLFAQQYYWRVRAMEGAEVSAWSEPFSFTIFETVDLNKPNNNAEEQEPNVDLKAKDRIGSALITGVDYFEFQADTTESFDSPLFFTGTSPTAVLSAGFLHFGETYYWRARVAHGADNSAWSDIRNFSVLNTVELDEPGDGDADLGLEIEFTWEEIGGVIDYTYQLDMNSGFTNPFSVDVEDIGAIITGFEFDNEYFWRVRANHATDMSGWSEARSLTTIATVNLSTPEDGATDIEITPILEWDMISGVDTFNVVYGDTPGLENPIAEMSIEGTQNEFQIIYNLDKNTSYYWKVRAVKGIDASEWSDTWTFMTEPEVSINEPFDENNINIYPNPSSGTLHVDVIGEENTEVTIYIMDLLGQMHVEQRVVFSQGNSSQSFDLSGLANGLYLVKLNKGDHSYTHKIAIHK